jgi:UBX domain-containing protein 6
VTELPDEYFKRDASEIQAEFKAAAERRENAGALMTKAWREKNINKNGDDDDDDKADARPVTVRVRVPDGCVLEGKFMPREPIAVVREWVSGALREHFRAFALRCVLYAGPHTTASAW